MLRVTEALVMGVDGGGSSTTAWLAKSEGPADPLGVGVSGSSNTDRSQSIERAFHSIELAIEQAFAKANLQRQPVACAVLALAGCGRQEEREEFRKLALEKGIASQVHIVSDVAPLLELTESSRPAIALVCGTGSIGVARDADGSVHRSGGWGYLFGDEASGYSLGVSALRSIASAHDQRGPATLLTQLVCDYFAVESPPDLIKAVYGDPMHHRTVGKLGPLVIQTANHGDEVAATIVETEVDELMRVLESLVFASDIRNQPFSLLLSGGLFVHEPTWLDRIVSLAKSNYPAIAETTLVSEPTRGAVLLAQRKLSNQ